MADAKAYMLTVHSVTNINSSCKWYVKVKLSGKNKQKSKAFKPVKNAITFNETFYFPSWGDNVVVQLSVWKERRFTHVEVAHTELECPAAPRHPSCKYELKEELFPVEKKKKEGESGARSRANTGLGGVDNSKPCGEITFTVVHTSAHTKYEEEEKKAAAAKAAAAKEEEKKVAVTVSPVSSSSPKPEPQVQEGPSLTAEEIDLQRKRKLVQDSWEIMDSAKIREQATRLLLGRWWETDASARALFQNSVVGNSNGMLKNLGTGVKLLNSPQELARTLLALGQKHATYGVKSEHFNTLGTALMWTLQIGLGSKWTRDLEEAWIWAFSMFSSGMVAGLEKERVHTTMIQYKKEIVGSWGLVKNAEDMVSNLFYESFFKIDPSISLLFKNVDMVTQKPLFIKMIHSLVSTLDQPELLETNLKSLATRHKGFGVVPAHLDTFTTAFLHTLKTGLGPAYTNGVREAWTWLLGVVSAVMVPNLESSPPASAVVPITTIMARSLSKEACEVPVIVSMLTKYKQQIVASWELVKQAEETVTTLFYGRYFEMDPSVKDLFKQTDFTLQKPHLIKMVKSLVNNLNDPSVVATAVRELAVRHKGYGVKPAHLDAFGATFLWALQTGLGDKCTAEMVSGWTWLLSVVGGIFRDALETPAPTQPAAVEAFQTVLVPETKKEEPVLAAMLTKYRKEVVASWELALNVEDTVSTLFYGRYFELEPAAGELFSKVKPHLQKPHLMKMMQYLVDNLSHPTRVVSTLRELATRHKRYGVRTAHFDTLAACFLWALQTGLRDQFTDAMREGWIYLLSVVSGIFRDAHEDAPKSVPSTPASRGKQIIQSSWGSIEPIGEKAGVLFFGCLFEADPSIRNLFANVSMDSHIKLFVKALSFAVANLDNPSTLIPHITTLALKHAHIGLTSQHFNSFGAALFQTFKIGLGDKWSESVRGAWVRFFSELAVIMTTAIEEQARQQEQEKKSIEAARKSADTVAKIEFPKPEKPIAGKAPPSPPPFSASKPAVVTTATPTTPSEPAPTTPMAEILAEPVVANESEIVISNKESSSSSSDYSRVTAQNNTESSKPDSEAKTEVGSSDEIGEYSSKPNVREERGEETASASIKGEGSIHSSTENNGD